MPNEPIDLSNALSFLISQNYGSESESFHIRDRKASKAPHSRESDLVPTRSATHEPLYDIDAACIPLTDADYGRIASLVPQGRFVAPDFMDEWADDCEPQ